MIKVKNYKTAPLIVFVYDCPNHTHRTLEALRKIELADHHELVRKVSDGHV